MFKLTIIDDTKPTYNWEHSSHLTTEYLQKYGNGTTFVETGTYNGDTVRLALNSGFHSVYSCELNEELYSNCVEMFKNNDNVKILLGDSVDSLEEILSFVDGPATFWLDAHASGHLSGGKTGGSPVIDELKLIAQHKCKEHTIFIDDRRLFGSAEWSYVQEKDAFDQITKINPDYNVYFLDGHQPQDVICVTLK